MWVCPVVHVADGIYIDDQYQEALGFMLVYETKAQAEVHAAGIPVRRLLFEVPPRFSIRRAYANLKRRVRNA